jgi:hypothetical protein
LVADRSGPRTESVPASGSARRDGWVVVGIVLAFVVEATVVTGYALWLAGVF